MAKFLLLVVLSVICTIGYAKHIHPRNVIHKEDDSSSDSEQISTNMDGIPVDELSQLKPSRFVPANNVLFFVSMRYPPCEEGFERDLLGVCREVWD